MNIFNLLARLIDSFLSLVVGLFPSANQSIVTAISDNSANFRDYLESASYLFPANTLLLLGGFILTIEASLFGYRLVKLILGYVTGGILRD